MTTKVTDDNFGTIANRFIQWQPVVVADGSTITNLEAGKGYFIDTSSFPHSVQLPANPSIGDSIALKDYGGNVLNNRCTILRNGENIQGITNDAVLKTNKASVTMVYLDSTKGWIFTKESNVADLSDPFISASGGTETTSGNFKIHTFTGDGTFTVTCSGGPTGSTTVDYLVIAGGGGGHFSCGSRTGGGGGAGGYRQSYPNPATGGFPISAQSYPITVGAGGAGKTGSTPGCVSADSGSNSVFSTITSAGGGGGGTASVGNGGPGGSGGGGGGTGGSQGLGNTPPVSPPQGNNSGTSSPDQRIGAGGGGAGGVGSNSPGPSGFADAPGVSGGNGSPSTISGSNVTRAGGGGTGGVQNPGGAGGPGGGGAGGDSGSPGSSGTANTGGGGGSGGQLCNSGGSGGKGIVIIRYKYQ